MKYHLLILLFATLFFTACSSDSDSPDTAPVTCAAPANFTIVQNGEFLDLEIAGAASSEYILGYTTHANANPGASKFIDTNNAQIPISDLFMEPGETYYFSVQTFCASLNRSVWIGPKAITIAEYCRLPYNLQMEPGASGPRLTWSSQNDDVSHQVQFGPSGFALGSGTSTTTGGESLNGMPMQAGTEYDFYVRSYCNGSAGWTDWVGPYTYLATSSTNLCTQPTDLTYTMESATAVGFHWDYNGESLFEYALVSGSLTIDTVPLETIGTGGTPVYAGLSPFITYKFYVRAVCSGGNRTPWTTILVDF